MRTTFDIDDATLQALKNLQKVEAKPLGRLASDLIAEALHGRVRATPKKLPPFAWHSKAMQPRVDLSDKAAVFDVLDKPQKS
ncbi:MAG: hypothetical protein ACO3E7_08650 [Burkholderiaceae bacterium]